MAQSFETWWASLGPVTKFVLVMCITTGMGLLLNIIPLEYQLVDWNRTVTHLELWRPFTAMFFLGKPGFPWLFNIAMMVMYTQRQEEDHAGRLADLVWLFTLVGVALHVVGFLMGMPVVSFSLMMALLWIWCRRHEDATLSLYMFSFRAPTFPWVLMAFHLVMGQSPIADLIGVVCGHLYFFLCDMLPKTHGMTLIRTPAFVERMFPSAKMGAYTVHAPAQARPGGAFPAPGGQGGQPPQRHLWGQGNALGR